MAKKKQIKYCYPALIKRNDDNEGYIIKFIDFENCQAEGENLIEAIENAREVGALHLDKLLSSGNMPAPTEIEDINISESITLIDFNIDVYKFKNRNKAITRAVTLPFNLNELAKASDINVSALLQEALKEKLDLED